MISKVLFAKEYASYLAKATNEHGIHSPFVFDLYLGAIKQNSQERFYCYKPIEKLRESLFDSKAKINITDLGAGSRVSNSKTKSIASIVRSAVKPTKYGQLLFRIANYLQCKHIVELGTSLGVTTAYLASVNSQQQITTFEGCLETQGVAKQNIKQLGLNNVDFILGNFDETLPAFLANNKTVDFVYVDGNHKEEPTLRYFEWLLEKTTEDTVLVFDDIYWSQEMKNAWTTIKQHPSVSISLDFFHLGMVFFKKDLKKQDFVLKF